VGSAVSTFFTCIFFLFALTRTVVAVLTVITTWAFERLLLYSAHGRLDLCCCIFFASLTAFWRFAICTSFCGYSDQRELILTTWAATACITLQKTCSTFPGFTDPSSVAGGVVFCLRACYDKGRFSYCLGWRFNIPYYYRVSSSGYLCLVLPAVGWLPANCARWTSLYLQ